VIKNFYSAFIDSHCRVLKVSLEYAITTTEIFLFSNQKISLSLPIHI